MQEIAVQGKVTPKIIEKNILAEANQLTNPTNQLSRNWRDVIQDYTALTKPRIIVLLLITTAGAMWIASEGEVDLFLMFVTVVRSFIQNQCNVFASLFIITVFCMHTTTAAFHHGAAGDHQTSHLSLSSVPSPLLMLMPPPPPRDHPLPPPPLRLVAGSRTLRTAR